jgi:hypothetical protein
MDPNDNNSKTDSTGPTKTSYQRKLDEYLRKEIKNPLESTPLSDQEKKDFIHRKLVTEEYRPAYIPTRQSIPMTQRAATVWNLSMKYFYGRKFKQFYYESAPLIAFSIISVLIGWKMQDELDKIRRKVVVNKSLREEDVERENRFLQAQLSDDKDFSNVPILDVEPGYRYSFGKLTFLGIRSPAGMRRTTKNRTCLSMMGLMM